MKFLAGLILPVFYSILGNAQEQYPPAAGFPGSTAIHRDSSIIKEWASQCEVYRGFISISDTTLTYNGCNKPIVGDNNSAVGKADGNVVSLGDGGSAILTFTDPVFNGQGPDFAVFENGFEDLANPGKYFLELAFVEVSSDGMDFVRFPAVSLTQTDSQINTFGHVDPTKIHNLAGKYAIHYGVPFDLDDLTDTTGIDINHISHIKITDVTGCLQDPFGCLDSRGNKVNDPWPTPFNNCGFDLDAVAVIHSISDAVPDQKWIDPDIPSVYPTLVHKGSAIRINIEGSSVPVMVSLISTNGMVWDTKQYTDSFCIDHPILESIPAGIYFMCISDMQNHWIKKILIIE